VEPGDGGSRARAARGFDIRQSGAGGLLIRAGPGLRQSRRVFHRRGGPRGTPVCERRGLAAVEPGHRERRKVAGPPPPRTLTGGCSADGATSPRSEEHTSELQSRGHLVCRLLLEKKKHDRLILSV